MIIKTRYRDIPAEQAIKCAGPTSAASLDTWERNCRGREIQIITPATDQRGNRNCGCDGPWYIVVGKPRIIVCPHLAEIGD